MTRWEVERAVLGSDLNRTERLILLALLTYVDVATVVTPAAHTPSLTRLAECCALDRSNVRTRYLSRLEAKGWLQRQRPPVEQSRKGVRTRYRVGAPAPLPNDIPGRVGAPTGRRVGAPNLGAPARPRSEPKPISDQERAGLAVVAETLELATGKKISSEDARRAVALAVNGRPVRDPYRYAVKVIREDANPRRFALTSQPPSSREVLT
jgi:hypothetical protein